MNIPEYVIGHYENISLEPIKSVIDGVLYIEEWRPVKGYKGKYEVSSFGRIKSLNRSVKIAYGAKREHLEKIMKQHLTNQGHCGINLPIKKIGKKRYKHCLVHRLVAAAFIINHKNKPVVNHTLGIKYFNHFSKLEWTTYSENSKHSYEIGLQAPNIPPNSRKVICTETGIEYRSVKYAAEQLGINYLGLYDQLTGRYKNKTKLKLKK